MTTRIFLTVLVALSTTSFTFASNAKTPLSVPPCNDSVVQQDIKRLVEKHSHKTSRCHELALRLANFTDEDVITISQATSDLFLTILLFPDNSQKVASLIQQGADVHYTLSYSDKTYLNLRFFDEYSDRVVVAKDYISAQIAALSNDGPFLRVGLFPSTKIGESANVFLWGAFPRKLSWPRLKPCQKVNPAGIVTTLTHLLNAVPLKDRRPLLKTLGGWLSYLNDGDIIRSDADGTLTPDTYNALVRFVEKHPGLKVAK